MRQQKRPIVALIDTVSLSFKAVHSNDLSKNLNLKAFSSLSLTSAPKSSLDIGV